MTTTLEATGVRFNDNTLQTTAASASSYTGGRGAIAYYASASGSNIVWNSNGISTFTVPTGITAVKVTLCGGGGAGGSGAASQGHPGGSSSAYVISFLTGLTPGAAITVTVGAGGVGQANATGTAGGTSSFGAYVSSTGGAARGGAGGTASGTYNYTFNGTNNTAAGSAGVGLGYNPLIPAISFGGCGSIVLNPRNPGILGGAGGTGTATVGTGGAATGYGCGGGGSWRDGSNPRTGGNGFPGIVIIEW